MDRCATLLCFLLVFEISNAQEEKRTKSNINPTPVELNVGNNRFGIQFVINKTFSPTSNFSFFALTNFNSDYENKVGNLDFINISQLRYEIYKGFSLGVGLVVNSRLGIAPTVGPQYTYIRKTIFLVLSPSIELTKTKNIQGLSIFEFKPVLTTKINLYSRFEAMYNYNLKDDIHSRSYIQLRLGVGIDKYQFGLSTNLDYYGPNRNLVENYGVFLRVNF